jgi:predicted nucleic acid-binding protein
VAAARLAADAKLSIWDAMVIHSAQASGCSILWSEDLSHGQEFGSVRVTNPFAR